MPIALDHTIVPVHDRREGARFFAFILGLEPGVEAGPFVAVAVNDTLTLDFDDRGAFEPHHYGFRVDGGTLEAAVARLRGCGARFGAGPGRGWDGQVDRSEAGARVYFRDASGHSYELFAPAG